MGWETLGMKKRKALKNWEDVGTLIEIGNIREKASF